MSAQKKPAKAKADAKAGPLCKCGHGMYEHYMCGSPESMWCYYGKKCGCKQFKGVDR